MPSNSTPHHSGNSPAKIKKGMMRIPPKDLNIVWGNDSRYWNVPNNKDLAAELYQVCWLEVTGTVEEASAEKNYEVGFKVSLKPDAFGWGNYPIYIMIKRGKQGKTAWTKISIDPNKKGEFDIKGRLMMTNSADHDDDDTNKLYFGLYEIWSGKWKGGLKIHNAFVNQF